MPLPNPVFKLGLEGIMPGLHLDLTKNTPGLLKYCQCLTNTTAPQTIIKFVEKPAFVPKETFFTTFSKVFWFIATWLGAFTVGLLAFVAIGFTCMAFSNKQPNSVPCESLRKSIASLHMKINNNTLDSENKKKFDERYESVTHHDDRNSMKRTITIVEKLDKVSEDGKECPAWENRTLNKEGGEKEVHVECSDDAGLLLCCTQTPKQTEFMEVAETELIKLEE